MSNPSQDEQAAVDGDLAQDGSRRRARKIPAWRKLIYAMVPLVFMMLLLEGGLAWSGYGAKEQADDPFVGFSNYSPLLEEMAGPNGQRLYTTRSGKLVWFNPIRLEAPKPKSVKRVFCMGGSTTYGRPFYDATSFCGWLRELVPAVLADSVNSSEDSETEWEFHNAGGVSYASYRVVKVMEELARFEPDLFIVYTGHNEFLEDRTYADIRDVSPLWMRVESALANSRTYLVLKDLLKRNRVKEDSEQTQLTMMPEEVDERLNHTIGPYDYDRDPEWSRGVVTHFAFNIRRMVEIAEGCGAKILFVVPASNEKDCSPFKAMPGSGTQDELARSQELYAKGLNSRSEGALDDSVRSFSEAKDIDPVNASILFELGRSEFEGGDVDDALRDLRIAIDEDVCPLRATSAIVKTLKEVASEAGAPTVDFVAELRKHSLAQYGHPVLGDEYFLDHVHPTIEAHGILAKAVVNQILSEGWFSPAELGEQPKIDWKNERWSEIYGQVEARILSGVDVTTHGIALRNLAKVMHWSGKFEDASRKASDAMELLGDDSESRFVLADCLKNMGQLDSSLVQYRFLMEDDPYYARAYLPYGEVLMMASQFDDSLVYLDRAHAYEPDNAYLHYTYGRLYMKLGRWRRALDSLELSHQLSPHDGTLDLIDECKTMLAPRVKRGRHENNHSKRRRVHHQRFTRFAAS